jgi:hypothetical protein
MKTFNVKLLIEKEIEAEDEEEAKSNFLEELENETNLSLANIIAENLEVVENKNLKMF